jgi:hypothetical protein
MGIIASTDRFTASHTTSKSLTVAAQMMAAGAKQQAVVRSLYRDGKGGDRQGGSNERPQSAQRDGAARQEAKPASEARHEPKQPVQTERPEPERSRTEDLPIIQPSHIELSSTDAKVEHVPAPTVRESAPMADFAAATEMFSRPDLDRRSDIEQAQ